MQLINRDYLNPNTLAILFLCDYNGKAIRVNTIMQFQDTFVGLDSYANIPNPASHLVCGPTQAAMLEELNALETIFNTHEHIAQLNATI